MEVPYISFTSDKKAQNNHDFCRIPNMKVEFSGARSPTYCIARVNIRIRTLENRPKWWFKGFSRLETVGFDCDGKNRFFCY